MARAESARIVPTWSVPRQAPAGGLRGSIVRSVRWARSERSVPERRPPVLVFLIDAFRHDFISGEHSAPRRAGHRPDEQGRCSRSWGTAMQYARPSSPVASPDETNYWMEYAYRPHDSPWRGMGRFSPPSIDCRVTWRCEALSLGTVRRRSMKPLAQRRRADRISTCGPVPFRAIDKFDLTLHEPMTAPGCAGLPEHLRRPARPRGGRGPTSTRRECGRGADLLDQVDRLPVRRWPCVRVPAPD